MSSPPVLDSGMPTLVSRREPDLQDAVNVLERDGIALLPDLLSPSELANVVEFFQHQPVMVQKGRSVSLERLPAGTAMAAYELPTVVACPWLMSALNRPAILRLASAYVGCKPTISAVGVRWSFPGATAPEMTQAFHRDPDDWRFLKLFVYLTDVDDGTGPHVYVSGSHKTSGRLRGDAYSKEAGRGPLREA